MTSPRALARKRGHDLERQVARDLTATGFPAQRNLEYQEGSVDVIAVGLPFSIQCKNQANPSVWKALKEAESAASKIFLAKHPTDVPIAVVRRQKQTVAVIYWKDFLKLLGGLKK